MACTFNFHSCPMLLYSYRWAASTK